MRKDVFSDQTRKRDGVRSISVNYKPKGAFVYSAHVLEFLTSVVLNYSSAWIMLECLRCHGNWMEKSWLMKPYQTAQAISFKVYAFFSLFFFLFFWENDHFALSNRTYFIWHNGCTKHYILYLLWIFTSSKETAVKSFATWLYISQYSSVPATVSISLILIVNYQFWERLWKEKETLCVYCRGIFLFVYSNSSKA